jgi:hypothetical protein
MLLTDRQASAAADAQQAERWREWLLQERSDLIRELWKRRTHLQDRATSADPRKLSNLRRGVHVTESDLIDVERMIDSLARRFPDVAPTLRPA